jgi:hypothetical protein
MPTPLTDFEKKKQFLLEHEDYFIESISGRHKFSHQQLTKYESILFWYYVVANQYINWTTEIMDEFKDRIFEDDDPLPRINFNESLPWSIEFIERYEHLWNWFYLAQNDMVMGNPEIRKRFYSYLYKYIADYEDMYKSPYNDEGKSEADIIEQKLSELDSDIESQLRSSEEIDSTKNINWRRLSMNEVLPWSAELIEKYKDKWDWEWLSTNESIPWNLEWLKRFEDRIDWSVNLTETEDEISFGLGSISGNFSIEWDAEILSTYLPRLNKCLISNSHNAKWDIDMLIQFADFWVYTDLALNSAVWEKVFPEFDSEEQIIAMLDIILERSKEKEKEDLISQLIDSILPDNNDLPPQVHPIDPPNTAIQLQLQFPTPPLSDFEKKKQFLLENEVYLIQSLSFRCKLTRQQLTKYQNLLIWHFIVCNRSINWTTEILDEFKDRIFEDDDPFPEINLNESLPWSIEFIERYEDLWEWFYLAKNDEVMGNPEIRQHFYSRVSEYIQDYEEMGKSGKSEAELLEAELKELSQHKEWQLRSSEEIDRTQNINWMRLSQNKILPWSPELIEKYKDKWEWKWLTMNQSIPWNLELIKQFEDKIDWFTDTGELVYCVGTLSGNMSVPWDAEILSTYRHRLNRSDVSIGQNAKWDIDLLIQFKDFWDYDILVLNQLIWEKVFPEFDSEEQINELLDAILERRK